MSPHAPADLDRLRRRALLVGAAGAAVALLVALLDLQAFAQAYLAALTGWSAVPLGCLAVLMMSHLVTGVWGATLHDALRAGCRTLPLTALLFVPMLATSPLLYPWMRDPAAGGLQAVYLVPWFFILRTVIYFAIWIALSRLMLAGDPARRGTVAAAGLILYALTGSLAGIDWMMSLDPSFHSSIYGLMILTHQMLAGLAFAVAVSLTVGGPKARTDGLAALLLSGVLLWAYFAAMQYIIIWSGDLPEEVRWYLSRTEAPWGGVLLAIVLLHGLAPFVAFLSPAARSDRRALAGVAVLILAMRLAEAFWLTLPAMGADGALVWIAGAASLVGIGGLWLAMVLHVLRAEAQARSSHGPARHATAPPSGTTDARVPPPSGEERGRG